MFREEASHLPCEELNTDLVEISSEIDFLKAQVDAETSGYSLTEMKVIDGKICNLKTLMKILDLELARRNLNS